MSIYRYNVHVGDCLPFAVSAVSVKKKRLQLPSYFTRVDTFVLFATVLVFATLGVAIATSRIAISGNKQLALRIEDWAKVIYLVIFILLIFFTLIP